MPMRRPWSRVAPADGLKRSSTSNKRLGSMPSASTGTPTAIAPLSRSTSRMNGYVGDSTITTSPWRTNVAMASASPSPAPDTMVIACGSYGQSPRNSSSSIGRIVGPVYEFTNARRLPSRAKYGRIGGRSVLSGVPRDRSMTGAWTAAKPRVWPDARLSNPDVLAPDVREADAPVFRPDFRP